MDDNFTSIRVSRLTWNRLKWLAIQTEKRLTHLADDLLSDCLSSHGVPVSARDDDDMRNLVCRERGERRSRQVVKVTTVPKILVAILNRHARKQGSPPGRIFDAVVTEYVLHMRTRKVLPMGVHHYYGPSAEKGVIRGVHRSRLDQISDDRMRPAKLVDATRLYLYKRGLLPAD